MAVVESMMFGSPAGARPRAQRGVAFCLLVTVMEYRDEVEESRLTTKLETHT